MRVRKIRSLRFAIVTLLVLFLLATASAQAQARRYALDPVHTRVMFAVSHAGFSDAIGTVSGSTGELWFDPDNWSSARLSVRVPITRVDLGNARWNQATLARNLLDAQHYPEASFVSTRIEPRDAQHAAVFGTLTLRGVAHEIRLDVTLNAAKRHPLPPFRRTLGFSATATLSRKAFGIDAWSSMIGDAVELRVEAEAVRARSDDDNARANPPQPAQTTATDAVDETESIAPESWTSSEPADRMAEPKPKPEPKPEPEPEPEPGLNQELSPEPSANPNSEIIGQPPIEPLVLPNLAPLPESQSTTTKPAIIPAPPPSTPQPRSDRSFRPAPADPTP